MTQMQLDRELKSIQKVALCVSLVLVDAPSARSSVQGAGHPAPQLGIPRVRGA